MNRKIAKSLVDFIKEKPRTRFELIELFGKHVGNTVDAQIKNGFIGKRKIANKNPNVRATHVLEFYFIKNYVLVMRPKTQKQDEKRFRNKIEFNLTDEQFAMYKKNGGYKWLRSCIDGVDL